MDRLICGDVGYGKTEVALRAAHKAAVDGKQVMMLVPTTILAQQHFGSFRERFADTPFNVEMVSRLRKPAKVKEALKRYSEGKVDVLLGTHRLLSRDVRAKDLGLLIVDEEQRFGVKQKELLRQLKLKVDVLSMSATPIPRTLQMSMAGSAGRSCARPSAAARPSSSTTASRPCTRPPSACAGSVPASSSPRRTARWTSWSWRRRCSPSCAASTTAW